MSNITTELCKESIVKWIGENPGFISAQFGEEVDEGPAGKISSWKRIIKRKASRGEGMEVPGCTTVREFDCVPYDDQLRAVVYDDGEKILRVVVEGE